MGSLQSSEPQPLGGRHVHLTKQLMKIAQRDAVILRYRGQRQVGVAQMRVYVSLHRPEPRLLHAFLVGRLAARFSTQSQGEDVHKLLAEFRSGLRIELGALRRKDGAEFDGDAAQAAAEIEMREKRRAPRIEAAVKGLARQLDPELSRPEIALQLIRLVRVVYAANSWPQEERRVGLAYI